MFGAKMMRCRCVDARGVVLLGAGARHLVRCASVGFAVLAHVLCKRAGPSGPCAVLLCARAGQHG